MSFEKVTIAAFGSDAENRRTKYAAGNQPQ